MAAIKIQDGGMIETKIKLVPSLRTGSRQHYEENLKPTKKEFQSDTAEASSSRDSCSISLRTLKRLNLFKRKASFAQAHPTMNVSKLSLDNESASSMQIISHAAAVKDSQSILVIPHLYVPPEKCDSHTDSSEIDSTGIFCIDQGSLKSVDKFGPPGCVCDDEAIYTLPDEDWEPVHEVGDVLKFFLKKTEEELEQAKRQLFEDCAIANRSVDDKMVLQMRMLDDYLKSYQYEMEKILKLHLELHARELTEKKYFSTQQAMHILLHKINHEIKHACIGLQTLESERAESLKKAFLICVQSQMSIGNKSFENIMMEMENSIRIVNEQLTENVHSICEMATTAADHCKATIKKNKSRLNELYMLAEINDEVKV